jgi:hypothetical protein
LIAVAWNYYGDRSTIDTSNTVPTTNTNTNTTNNTDTTMNTEFNWVGKYDAYTQVEGANDGSRLYKLEIVKNGDKYDITYHESGMTRENYKGIGTLNDGQNMTVTFLSSDYEYANKNYDKGDTLMTLKSISKNSIEVMWVQPEIDKGIPVKPITLKREGSDILDM